MWNKATVANLRYYFFIFLLRAEENHETAVSVAGRYSNPGNPDYEAGVLTTQPQCESFK
jgi:hypothetical protein